MSPILRVGITEPSTDPRERLIDPCVTILHGLVLGVPLLLPSAARIPVAVSRSSGRDGLGRCPSRGSSDSTRDRPRGHPLRAPSRRASGTSSRASTASMRRPACRAASESCAVPRRAWCPCAKMHHVVPHVSPSRSFCDGHRPTIPFRRKTLSRGTPAERPAAATRDSPARSRELGRVGSPSRHLRSPYSC